MSYPRRTFPHRCVKCEARRTLQKLWSRYTVKPRCQVCGYYRLYPCRDRLPSRWGRRHLCGCEGYHFKHRRRSKYCEHHPKAAEHHAERRDR